MPILNSESLTDMLAQTSFKITRILNKLAAKYKLSFSTIRILGILRDRQISLIELANYLGLDKSTTTGIINRCTQKNLVTKQVSANDSRVKLISLTDNGKKLTEKYTTEFNSEINQITKTLTNMEQENLAELLQKIVQPATTTV